MDTEQHSVTAETDSSLRVVRRGLGQFEISNTHYRLSDFEREYINFSGYFGPYPPELFAAAPELLEAAQKALNYISNTESELGITLDSGDALRAALAKVGA